MDGIKRSEPSEFEKSPRQREAHHMSQRVDHAGRNVERVGSMVQHSAATAKHASQAGEIAGKGVKNVGKGVQAAAKATGAGSDALMNAGKAASATAVGAVVGVPMIAVGALGKGASIGAQFAGKGLEAGGKLAEETAKATKKLSASAENAGKNIKSAGSRVRGAAKKMAKHIHFTPKGFMKNMSITARLAVCSVIFWAIGLLPLMGTLTGIMYSILWVAVLLKKFGKLILMPKIFGVYIICSILSWLPFISWIPWTIVGTIMTTFIATRTRNKMIKMKAEAAAMHAKNEQKRQMAIEYNQQLQGMQDEEDDYAVERQRENTSYYDGNSGSRSSQSSERPMMRQQPLQNIRQPQQQGKPMQIRPQTSRPMPALGNKRAA
ncbi:MAG: hypothetical protein V4519_00345 [Patescibacteria group bacterium]